MTGFPLLFTVVLRSHVPRLWELAAKLLHISFAISPTPSPAPHMPWLMFPFALVLTLLSVLLFSDDPIRLRREVVLLTDDRNLRVKALTRHVPVRDIPAFLKWAKVGWRSHMSESMEFLCARRGEYAVCDPLGQEVVTVTPDLTIQLPHVKAHKCSPRPPSFQPTIWNKLEQKQTFYSCTLSGSLLHFVIDGGVRIGVSTYVGSD